MKQDVRTVRAQEDGQQIPALDGLRGLAALWVFLSHVRILTGMTPVPTLLAYGALAVDLFMFVSGFLMAFHYLERREQEPWNVSRTWLRFWCRRLFRITPAYYVLLLISLITGAYLGDARDAVAHFWPETATVASRYLDHSVSNVVTHVTYAFGLFPRYAFNTPLPDWSIGLEMQFYAVFPLLMLLIARYGALLVIATLSVAMFGVQLIAPGFFSSFPMPAFLPMKLYMFMTGMAAALTRGTPRASLGFLLAVSLPSIEFALHPGADSRARIAMVAILFILFSAESIRFGALALPAVRILRRVLGIPFGKVMGDLAYSFYLVHLLVLLPVAGFLTKFERYVNAPGSVRFAVVALIVGPITFALSWLLYRAVEKPGIALGKRLLKRRIVMNRTEAAI